MTLEARTSIVVGLGQGVAAHLFSEITHRDHTIKMADLLNPGSIFGFPELFIKSQSPANHRTISCLNPSTGCLISVSKENDAAQPVTRVETMSGEQIVRLALTIGEMDSEGLFGKIQTVAIVMNDQAPDATKLPQHTIMKDYFLLRAASRNADDPDEE